MIESIAQCQLDIGADEIIQFICHLPASSYPALLDSCKYQDYGLYDGRYLIAAHSPEICWQAMNDECYEISREGEKIMRGNALARLDQLLMQWQLNKNIELSSSLPCSAGAAIGLFSYDLGRYCERMPTQAKITHIAPDIFVCCYNTIIAHDYLTKQTTLIACSHKSGEAQTGLQKARSALERALTRLKIKEPAATSKENFHYTSNFTRAAYLRAVERIKEHIRIGDIYQANLTQQYEIALATRAPEDIFMKLREQFPAPFIAYIKTPDWSVVSASPERFLRRSGNLIEAFPIKGTRPRGADADADRRMQAELLASEKDIAENIMIVDLLRNDLGRVCEIGSIDASQLLKAQAFPTLFHLVSKISGQLRPDIKLSELLRAAFPCGSITGAPKLRAMEIIEAVEMVRRGLSMGAIGWLGYQGDLDLNVAIRTLFMRNGRGYFNVGGAVVADSDPIGEYEEAQLKARALFHAIGCQTGE
jgi:para-aminobenzoate synthetase component 1